MRKRISRFARSEYEAKYGALVGEAMERIVEALHGNLRITSCLNLDSEIEGFEIKGFVIYEDCPEGLLISAWAGVDFVRPWLEKQGKELLFISAFEQEWEHLEKKGHYLYEPYSSRKFKTFRLSCNSSF